MPVISLLTDFGTKDGFVGTMKGVIWQICPSAQIADISHEISAQNVREGAIALWRAAPYFPAGTVHIAVVDPGVGTARRGLAAKLGTQYVVGPDNGLFTPMIDDARLAGLETRFAALENQRYWLQNVSHTFHGRDIYAPVGAHLANGVALEELGPVFSDPVMLPLSRPIKTTDGFVAHISVVDNFGNLTTDLPAVMITGRSVKIVIKGQVIEGLSTSYGHHQPGDLVALIDSENYLEVAVVNGSGAQTLNAKVGDEVEVYLTPAE